MEDLAEELNEKLVKSESDNLYLRMFIKGWLMYHMTALFIIIPAFNIPTLIYLPPFLTWTTYILLVMFILSWITRKKTMMGLAVCGYGMTFLYMTINDPHPSVKIVYIGFVFLAVGFSAYLSRQGARQ